MKKVLYYIIGCILFSIVLSFGFSIVNVLSVSTTGFFLTLKQGHYQDAYGYMSDQFKKQYDLDAFKELINQSDLNKYQSSQWMKTFKNADNTEGYVMGTLTTTTGRKIPLKVNFIATGTGMMNRGWRIQSIELNVEIKVEPNPLNNLISEKPNPLNKLLLEKPRR